MNRITLSILALSGMRQLLETESPLKRMKNTFYFTLISPQQTITMHILTNVSRSKDNQAMNLVS